MFQNTGFVDSRKYMSSQLSVPLSSPTGTTVLLQTHGIRGFKYWIWADMKWGFDQVRVV